MSIDPRKYSNNIADVSGYATSLEIEVMRLGQQNHDLYNSFDRLTEENERLNKELFEAIAAIQRWKDEADRMREALTGWKGDAERAEEQANRYRQALEIIATTSPYAVGIDHQVVAREELAQ